MGTSSIIVDPRRITIADDRHTVQVECDVAYLGRAPYRLDVTFWDDAPDTETTIALSYKAVIQHLARFVWD